MRVCREAGKETTGRRCCAARSRGGCSEGCLPWWNGFQHSSLGFTSLACVEQSAARQPSASFEGTGMARGAQPCPAAAFPQPPGQGSAQLASPARGGCGRRTEPRNILALTQQLPGDALIFATVDSHCVAATRSGAQLGWEQQPRLRWGELGHIANHQPGAAACWGAWLGLQSPLAFSWNHNGAAPSPLCPGRRAW